MNTREKKELKCVLQKLSDKLEGKMVGGGATIESYNTPTNSLPYPQYKGGINSSGIIGLPFSFKYKKVIYSYFFNLSQLPGNDYKNLYNDTIKSITFSTTKLTIISSTMTKTYKFSQTIYNQGQLLVYSNKTKLQLVTLFQNNGEDTYLNFPDGINVKINIPEYNIQK
jgi:hypothetical protein